ncbi:HD domain-containing protein [Ureibacillus thermophilus]|uniref:HD domain-containing protein n=1 Tax=Ureibacillus thermophilus TaxID=367743 RepID=UPI003615FE5D
MIFQEKIHQISDPIHGSIRISEIEKQIISTQVFNRLHHVLQNSTAYLTFPSNKTSRFSHSIGSMHLGGEIFKYGLANASSENIKEFFTKIGNYVNKFIRDKDFWQDMKRIEIGSNDYKALINQLINNSKYEPFYFSSIPASVPKENYYYYVVACQSIRCAALLHDIGHPPFSHITESALDNIFIYLEKKKKENEPLTLREVKFCDIIKNYKTKGNQLHEELGLLLSEHIFDVVIDEAGLDIKKLFYLHIKHMTLSILKDKDDFYQSLHLIVSGPIDCDRLDYVSRDPLASGFKDGIIEYDRLIHSMKLIKYNNNFVIIPSAQVVNTIEDFFRRRWKLYKYIILHHRVVKTDSLLREVIETLSKEYLSKNEEESDFEGYKLPNDISGLWKVADYGVNITHGDFINHFIQWDDAWLLSCLRNEYFSLRNNIGEKDSCLIIKLEELLSNKKQYSSLFKRYDGFIELDTIILKEFNPACLKSLKENERLLPKLIDRIMFYIEHDSASLKNEYEIMRPFIYYLEELFDTLDKGSFYQIVQSSVYEVAQELKVDTIFKVNILKTGFEKQSVLVYSRDQVHYLDKYSNVKSELTSNKNVFPPFYIYTYSKENCRNVFIEKLGKKLAKKFEERINALANNL